MRNDNGRMRGWSRSAVAALALALLVGTGCERPPDPPPAYEVFYLTDRFFDVESFGDGEFLALAYRSKVIRSEDNGQTWAIAHPAGDLNMTRFTFFDEKNGVGVGHDGKVFRTGDGGKTWDVQSSGKKYSLFDLDVAGEDTVWAVGALSTIAKSTDGGRTWSAENLPISKIGVREGMSLAIQDPILYSVFFLDENTGWIVGEYGQIRFTEDGGKTWGAQHGPLLQQPIRYSKAKDTPPVRDIMTLPTFFHIRFWDRQHGIAVGTYGAIVTTDDGGETWRFNESPVKTPLYEIHLMPNGDALLAGSDGVVLRGNAQDGWEPVDLPPGIYTWLASLDFDESGNGLITGGYGTILRTEDFGRTWQQTLYQ